MSEEKPRLGRLSEEALARLAEAAQAVEGLIDERERVPSWESPGMQYIIAEQEARWAEEAEPAEDRSAYRPAKEFLDNHRFCTYYRVTRFLEKHPEIRRDKPNQQRLLIHAGDWHDCIARLAAASFNALEATPEMLLEFLAESHERQAGARGRKASK